jgi:hypothetical protein
VRALEEVLGLPAHSLVRLLGSGEAGGRPGAEPPAARPHHTLEASLDAAERLLTGLRSTQSHGLHTVGHQERVRIGAGRQLLGRESQQVVRAHRDGVDRCLAVHRGGRGCDPAAVEVSALENCRPGQVRWDRASGVVVAELIFDAPLREGETYVFGYGFEDGTGGPSTEYVRGFSSAGGQYMLQVRFEQGALPKRCHRFSRATTGAPRGARTPLTPGARHRTVHLVEQGVRPGILGIAWDWD